MYISGFYSPSSSYSTFSKFLLLHHLQQSVNFWLCNTYFRLLLTGCCFQDQSFHILILTILATPPQVQYMVSIFFTPALRTSFVKGPFSPSFACQRLPACLPRLSTHFLPPRLGYHGRFSDRLEMPASLLQVGQTLFTLTRILALITPLVSK